MSISGTPPNTSVVLTPDELRYIERRHRGSKSAAIHQALDRVINAGLKTDDCLELNPNAERFLPQLADLNRYDLDDLTAAIHYRRCEIMAAELRARGFDVRTAFNIPASLCREDGLIRINYLLIDDPARTDSGEYATLAEAWRLLDTVANLPPSDAFRRWREHIEPWNNGRPYTRQDAERDARAERRDLHRQYEAGQLDGEMFRIAMSQSGGYFDLAEMERPPEQVDVS